MCVEIRQAKSEAVKAEQKPGTTVAADARIQQLPNHRRQVLEPKSITTSENKVTVNVTSILHNIHCNILLYIACSSNR